jgi:hypothetical protein
MRYSIQQDESTMFIKAGQFPAVVPGFNRSLPFRLDLPLVFLYSVSIWEGENVQRQA